MGKPTGKLLFAYNTISAMEEKINSMQADYDRYQWIKNKDLETVHSGGVFAGRTPQNLVINKDDLDRAIDAEMNGE